MKKLTKIILTFALLLGLTACGSDSSTSKQSEEQKTETTVVKVGVVGAYNDQWDTVNEFLKD